MKDLQQAPDTVLFEGGPALEVDTMRALRRFVESVKLSVQPSLQRDLMSRHEEECTNSKDGHGHCRCWCAAPEMTDEQKREQGIDV